MQAEHAALPAGFNKARILPVHAEHWLCVINRLHFNRLLSIIIKFHFAGFPHSGIRHSHRNGCFDFARPAAPERHARRKLRPRALDEIIDLIFDPQKQQLAAVASARIVKPWCELILPGIDGPGAAKRSALYKRTKIKVCQNMAPGNLRLFCDCKRAVFHKAATPDAKIQLQPPLSRQNRKHSKRNKRQNRQLHALRSRRRDIPCRRLQRQNALCGVRLQIHRMNSAGRIQAFNAIFVPQGGFQRFEHRPIIRAAFPVSDGNICGDSAAAKFPIQANKRQRSRNILRILNLNIQNGMVARNTKAPQRLHARVIFLRRSEIFIGFLRRIKNLRKHLRSQDAI